MEGSEKLEEGKLEIAEKTQTMAEVPEKNYIETAKDVTKVTVSNIVHEVFESLSKVGTAWHEINPNSTPEDIQVYKEFVATQHEKIDKIFGTNRVDYSIESQEYAAAYKAAIIEELGYYPEMQIGELPPPGALISAVSIAATVASRTLRIVAKNGSAIGTAVAISSLSKPTSPPSPSLEASSVKATSKQLSKFRKQVQIDGKPSLDKSKISIQKRLDEHLIKLDKYKQEGGHTSSIEREIKNFRQELQAIDTVLEEANG